MTAGDVASFRAVLTSEHPDEFLSGTTRGQVDERARARVVWDFDERGQPQQNFRALILELPVASMRAFSDDGTSNWLDATIPGYGDAKSSVKI
ncbi:hypothetical protein PHMEG_00010005 [Phytophthora megakarya]|uniref:Uncharacterized protein n=1 Tax=Phytophthora megakarya TaxID=4795 RepID=A0A225WFQ7_9STRA|nr:hypothetical protein PHMEG_00010005 [Phytophthora megakarya]